MIVDLSDDFVEPVANMNSKLLTLLVLTLLSLPSLVFGQSDTQGEPVNRNSLKKIRVTPNAIASKIGSAIPWQTDFAAARAKSIKSNKPLFWYVPRLKGTFMDRKKEIDRYMRAGPFSNPQIIASLNEHYVPLLSVPEETEAELYVLKPFQFIEPGFLIIEPDGSLSTKLDRLTTLHSKWIASFLKSPNALPKPSESLQLARQQLAAGQYDACRIVNPNEHPAQEAVEIQMIAAMATFRLGKHAEATKRFAAIGEAFPNHPLGWKAAAEAQQIGPFVRGFETFRDLPEKAMNAGRQSLGSAAPPNTYTEPQLWTRGIEFLLSMQSEAGGFEDSDYDFGGSDSLPNVHVAVTALAAMALLESRQLKQLESQRPRIDDAIRKAVTYVSDPQRLNVRDRDEIFWAYLYRLRLMNRLYAKRLIDLNALQNSTDALISVQSKTGDWYHEYSNPFVTASALWAIKEAESLGAKADSGSVQAGIAALKRCRFANAAWTYRSPRNHQNPQLKKANRSNQISSAGRMPLCEGALVIWGQAGEDNLVASLQSAFEMHEALDVARKYDDHTSSYNYGGFFFWYDMHSRTDAILKITDPQTRNDFVRRQREIVMAVPEIDGCFVDSHEIGRSYGTAMALLCLSGCDAAEGRGQEQR